MRTKVILARRAKKDIRRVPRHIVIKLMAWTEAVEAQGLPEVRKCPGYHDEPLQGERKGQRSIRLSRAYRAVYEVQEDGEIELVRVEEVSKHDY